MCQSAAADMHVLWLAGYPIGDDDWFDHLTCRSPIDACSLGRERLYPSFFPHIVVLSKTITRIYKVHFLLTTTVKFMDL